MFTIAVLPTRLGLIALAILSAATASNAAESFSAGPRDAQRVAKASEEATSAIKRFAVPPGFKVDLFAAEPLLANPVSFSVDEKGRFYVIETFRHSAGVLDIRGRRGWPDAAYVQSLSEDRAAKLTDELLDADLAARTVDERVSMLKKYFGSKIKSLETESDRIRLIVDTDGDGKADASSVFADGFSSISEGIAAGVLAWKGNVWLANLPNLWLLKDTHGTGTADYRESLSYGYGVHSGFLGHDMHGLKMGPDGRLYFSIGDRGASVKTKNGNIVGNPDMGQIFRCNPDGSELEVFAFGLRNPQELAFDQFGNLFTGDNNSDSGDQARWVYAVEGGDSGWRTGYQYMEGQYSRGPFNAEKIWYPSAEGQPAHIVPPVANIGNGPSGVTYYPGTGLPASYSNHFFMVDFKGAGANSGVHTFTMEPKGASFTLTNQSRFIWNILATDADFGVDGGLYVLDWVEGWNKTGKGRLYRVYETNSANQIIVKQTRKLLPENFDAKSLRDLAVLLNHPDFRVRQEAQFALVNKGSQAIPTLTSLVVQKQNRFARVHAIWGLTQLARKNISTSSGASALTPIAVWLKDADPEIRAQAAKAAGEIHYLPALDLLVAGLKDSEPRVQFFSATSLGKMGRKDVIPALLELARSNADKDPLIRHAVVMALSGLSDFDALNAAARDSSPAVRMVSLLAMRRLARPEITGFLKDSEPRIVLEAARAINDEPVSSGMPELAALIESKTTSDPLLRRVLNANFRMGRAENAQALARYAATEEAPEFFRREALNELAEWPAPSVRDRLVGNYRPVSGGRDAVIPAIALKPHMEKLLAKAPDSVRAAAAGAAHSLHMPEYVAQLAAIVADTEAASSVRIAALRALDGLDDPAFAKAVEIAANDKNSQVRRESARLQNRLQTSSALIGIAKALDTGALQEKQAALSALAKVSGLEADTLAATWMEKLLSGAAPKELALDIVDAASKRSAGTVKSVVARYEAAKPKSDLTPYLESLYGGNAAEGKKIFYEKAEASCIKCHKAGGEGGEAGPNLAGISTRKSREYILESMVLPNKEIAPGFESVTVITKNGQINAGVLKSENADQIVINSPEDGLITVKKSDIRSREKGLSAMPEGLALILTREELRDIVEFLATLK